MHPNPDQALCDGPQALSPEMFAELMVRLSPVHESVGRVLEQPELIASPRGRDELAGGREFSHIAPRYDLANEVLSTADSPYKADGALPDRGVG